MATHAESAAILRDARLSVGLLRMRAVYLRRRPARAVRVFGAFEARRMAVELAVLAVDRLDLAGTVRERLGAAGAQLRKAGRKEGVQLCHLVLRHTGSRCSMAPSLRIGGSNTVIWITFGAV